MYAWPRVQIRYARSVRAGNPRRTTARLMLDCATELRDRITLLWKMGAVLCYVPVAGLKERLMQLQAEAELITSVNSSA